MGEALPYGQAAQYYTGNVEGGAIPLPSRGHYIERDSLAVDSSSNRKITNAGRHSKFCHVRIWRVAFSATSPSG